MFLGHSSRVQRSGRSTQSCGPEAVSSPAEDQEPLSSLSEVLSGSKVSRPECTMHEATMSASVKPQTERLRGELHSVHKLAPANSQMERTQCKKLRVLKSVPVEPQLPRVAECPTEVGYGGRGKKLHGATAILRKMGHVAVVTRPGRVALGTRPKHVVLAALPGTIALRAIVPEARRPVVETCAPQVGATASTSVVDVPLVLSLIHI